ncbi:MAG: rRNA maturation RNase YbeY [Candidatus Acidiferrales bacterium]
MNRQRAFRVPIKRLQEFAAGARRALRLPPESFTVCLVTSAEIAKWNRAYRHKSGPTDVLSFPAENDASPRKKRHSPRREGFTSHPEIDSNYLGDIAIAPAVARRNARRFGRTFSREMCILILHGMLHLMGYDHETDTGQMERRELRLRRQLGLA